MSICLETGELTCVTPFDFGKCLSFVADFTPAMGEQQVVGAASLTKAIMIDGHTVGFRVRQGDTHLLYELFNDSQLPAAVRRRAVEQLRFYLSLDDDLTDFYAIGQSDPYFAPILEQLYGMHHIKFPTLCEIACWSILTQHLAIPIAKKMKQSLVETYGGQITIDEKMYWAFPDLDRLKRVSADDFARVIGDVRRARYLVEVVKALSGMDEMWLRSASFGEAEARLREIPGIGLWSATFILVRGLGRMEHILTDQKPLLRLVPKVYGPGVTLEQIAQRYGK